MASKCSTTMPWTSATTVLSGRHRVSTEFFSRPGANVKLRTRHTESEQEGRGQDAGHDQHEFDAGDVPLHRLLRLLRIDRLLWVGFRVGFLGRQRVLVRGTSR